MDAAATLYPHLALRQPIGNPRLAHIKAEIAALDHRHRTGQEDPGLKAEALRLMRAIPKTEVAHA
jgi:hypothetical protein